MNQPSILVFVDWYLPAYKGGGIITSVASVIKNLERDHRFSIFTRNTDFGDQTQLDSVVSDQWLHLSENTKIHYSSKKGFRLRKVIREMSSNHCDVIYINSMFSFYFSILPLCIVFFKKLNGCKIIIAPMGMLAPEALKFKKYKKVPFLQITRFLGVYKNVKFHASSPAERDDIYRVFGKKANIFTAPYLFHPSHLINDEKIKQPGSMRLVYISRIAPIKNLLGIIYFLHCVNKNCKIEFGIYGPIEDKVYWHHCLEKIHSLPPNIVCQYHGELKGTEVIGAFQKFHFSILATEGENYGQVIPESFAAGTPAIISDRTPWQDLESHCAGWVIPFDQSERFITTLEYCTMMNQETYNRFKNGAFQYAVQNADNCESVSRLKEMFAA